MITYLSLILWFLFGLMGYGLVYAFFVRKFPYLTESRVRNLLLACLGPLNFLAVLIFLTRANGIRRMFKYGFKL